MKGQTNMPKWDLILSEIVGIGFLVAWIGMLAGVFDISYEQAKYVLIFTCASYWTHRGLYKHEPCDERPD